MKKYHIKESKDISEIGTNEVDKDAIKGGTGSIPFSLKSKVQQLQDRNGRYKNYLNKIN